MRQKASPRLQEVLFCFLSTFIMGLIAHAFCYFNILFSHDSILFHDDELWQISLGRFLQPWYRSFRGNLNAPWLLGALSLLWISISAFFIIRLFQIKSNVAKAVICGILSTNLTVTLANATYLPWTDIFMLALLTSVMGVYCFERFQYGFLLAPFFISVSMALYQSYYAVCIALLMLLMMKAILEGHSEKDILIKGIKAACTLVLSGVLYYITLQFVIFENEIVLSNSYNGLASLGNFSDSDVFKLIADVYHYFINYFLKADGYINPFVSKLHLVILLCFLYLVCKIIIQKRISKWNNLFFLVILLFIPLGFNIAQFLAKGMVHPLMVYSFVFVYIFVIWLFEFVWDDSQNNNGKNKDNHCLKIIVTLLCFAPILFHNIVFANGAYLKKMLEYQSTFSLMTRIADRIEGTNGYRIGETPVAIVGTLESSPYTNELEGFDQYKGTGFASSIAVTYPITYFDYFKGILNRPILWTSEDYMNIIATFPAVEQMPVFPNEGSCAFLDDVLVVKLS